MGDYVFAHITLTLPISREGRDTLASSILNKKSSDKWIDEQVDLLRRWPSVSDKLFNFKRYPRNMQSRRRGNPLEFIVTIPNSSHPGRSWILHEFRCHPLPFRYNSNVQNTECHANFLIIYNAATQPSHSEWPR